MKPKEFHSKNTKEPKREVRRKTKLPEEGRTYKIVTEKYAIIDCIYFKKYNINLLKHTCAGNRQWGLWGHHRHSSLFLLSCTLVVPHKETILRGHRKIHGENHSDQRWSHSTCGEPDDICSNSQGCSVCFKKCSAISLGLLFAISIVKCKFTLK